MTTRVVIAVVIAILAHVSLGAQAPDEDAINPDRPGIADGSNVIGRGRVQIETGYQYEHRRIEGDFERSHFLPTLLRVGLTSRWEARIEGNTFTHVNGQGADFSPISLGVKVHVLDADGRRQPSLGTMARVFPNSGTGSFHADRTTGDLRLAADWDLSSRLSLNPNVGVAWYEDDAGERVTAGLFAVTLSYINRAETINPFVDIALQSPEASGGETALIVDGGVAYLPTHNVQLDVSLGAGAHGRTPADLFVAVGISIRFQGWRK